MLFAKISSILQCCRNAVLGSDEFEMESHLNCIQPRLRWTLCDLEFYGDKQGIELGEDWIELEAVRRREET